MIYLRFAVEKKRDESEGIKQYQTFSFAITNYSVIKIIIVPGDCN